MDYLGSLLKCGIGFSRSDEWGRGVQRVCTLRSNQVMMVMLMGLVLWVARVQNADMAAFKLF